MNKNRILSNIMILASGRLTTMLISAVALIVMTRYLGPVRVGELAFAEAVIGLLGQVNAMGMETFLIRAIAREPQRSSNLVGAAMIVRGVMALPVPAVVFLYIHFAHINREISILIYLMAIGMIIYSFCVVLVWYLQAIEKMSYVALIDVVLNVLILVGQLTIILLHGSVAAFALNGAVVFVVLLGLSAYWSRPYLQLRWHFSWSDIREVVNGSLAFWAKDVTKTVYSYIDSVLLGSLAGARAVGFYSPPNRVFGVALSVPDIVGNATLPLLSRLGVDTDHDFSRVGRKTLAFLILTGIPLVVGLATFAGPVIGILFGPAFQPAVPVLVVLSFCLLPMFLNSQFAQILSARNRQWRWTGIMAVGTIINIALNLIAIPLAVHYWDNGALGAAGAMLATEVVMTVYGMVILRDVVLESSFVRTVIGAMIAGSAQAIVVVLVGSTWILLVAGEALGLGVYTAAVILLGAVPRHDVTLLWQTALRRVPRAV